VGPAPTGKRRLVTAHTQTSHQCDPHSRVERYEYRFGLEQEHGRTRAGLTGPKREHSRDDRGLYFSLRGRRSGGLPLYHCERVTHGRANFFIEVIPGRCKRIDRFRIANATEPIDGVMRHDR
jgi:hypothetical protein